MPVIPFQYVRKASGSVSGTFSSNNVGDLLVLLFNTFGNGVETFPSTITDGAGNVYTKIYSSSSAVYTASTYYVIYACPSCVASGSNLFTSPVAGTVYTASMGVEYTYTSGTVTVDTFAGPIGGLSSISVGNATVGDLAIAVGLNVGGAWTYDPSTNGRFGSSGSSLWQDQVVPSSGNYSQLTTRSGGVGSWNADMILIKAPLPVVIYNPVVHITVGNTLSLGE